MLIGFALVGALCSFAIGWLDSASVALLIAVPADRLGRIMGLRSILGVSAGAAAPDVFGLTLDLLPADIAWGYAFWTLGTGGCIAFICALGLKR